MATDAQIKANRENAKKAGRPQGLLNKETKKKQKLEKYLLKKVLEEKEEIITALFSAAKKGNTPAIKEIFDRTLGRVKENIDISSLGERINGVVVLPAKNNENKTKNTLEGDKETGGSTS